MNQEMIDLADKITKDQFKFAVETVSNHCRINRDREPDVIIAFMKAQSQNLLSLTINKASSKWFESKTTLNYD